MRKVVAGVFVSLDGVTESPDGRQFDHCDDEMSSQMAAQDAVLLGRVTYEEWASYWPTSTDEPFAGFINSTPKYVVSTTLEEPLEWNNSTLVGRNVADEIANLKRQPGENIAVQGSPTLVESLLQDDLLDELKLMGSIRRRWRREASVGRRAGSEEVETRGLEDHRHRRCNPHLRTGLQVRTEAGRRFERE